MFLNVMRTEVKHAELSSFKIPVDRGIFLETSDLYKSLCMKIKMFACIFTHRYR